VNTLEAIKLDKEQSLIRFRTRDGFLINSLLVTKPFKAKREILALPVLLEIHGLLGHFLARGTPRLLPHALLEKGYNCMAMNTRMAYSGLMTGVGVLDDTINDIDAAVQFLIDEGFRNVFVLGYSLGANMAVHWAANRSYPQVKGLILEGPAYSLPDTQRRRYDRFGSSPDYDSIYLQAKAVLGDDPYSSPNDETFVVYRAKGSNREPLNDEIYTYKTWWFMAGPEAHASITYELIDRIDLPILIIRGEKDPRVEAWEVEALAEILQLAGRKWVRQVTIPDAAHDCMENPDVMLKEITDMFAEHAEV
jgi:pimeloyl-ACP methyl ester carboxylesterase